MLVVYPVNFNNIPSLNFRLETVPAVTSGPAGRLYLNVATGFVECWNGAATLVMGAPMSTLANPNTLALRDGAGALTASAFNGPLAGNAATASVAANAILLGGNSGPYYLNRVNATGTQLSSTISDLTANIRSNSLDVFAKPANSIDLNAFPIINLADPANPNDAVTKRYVDNNVAATSSKFLTLAVYDPGATGIVNYAVTATLLAGVSPSYYLNRTNHSGTQLSSTISDLTSAIQAVPLNTLALPNGPISANGNRITLLGSPGLATDGATKGYIDSAIASIPPPQWSSIINVPPQRGVFIPLPNTTDTNPAQTEASGYDHYYFYGVSNWRRVLSVPFRPWVAVPANSSAAGNIGQTSYDANYFYVCCTGLVGANHWYRIALATWAGGTPFAATAAVPPGYTYTDGSYFYVSVALNTWMRFALTSFGQGVFGAPPTGGYYPGLPGMETISQDAGRNNFWIYCTAQNSWAYAALTGSF
jgi:hypothetical protein